MDIFLSICALVLAVLGLIGCIIPVIPATVFSFAGLLCCYFTSYSDLSFTALMIWAVVCVAAIVIDTVLPGYFAKKFGGTRIGVIGATIGMIAGFIFFNVVGVIIGPFVGAVLGELLHDRQDTDRAFKVGFGAMLSFFAGTGIKLIIGFWIMALIIGDLYDVVAQFVTNI